MDTDTAAGLSFAIAGLAMLIQSVLRSSINMTTVSFIAIAIVLLSLGVVMLLRNRSTALSPGKTTVFSILAIVSFRIGFAGYFYV